MFFGCWSNGFDDLNFFFIGIFKLLNKLGTDFILDYLNRTESVVRVFLINQLLAKKFKILFK